MWDSCFSSRWQLWMFAGFQNHSNTCISASDTRKNIISCSCSDPSNISSVIEANIAAEIVHRCFKLWPWLRAQIHPPHANWTWSVIVSVCCLWGSIQDQYFLFLLPSVFTNADKILSHWMQLWFFPHRMFTCITGFRTWSQPQFYRNWNAAGTKRKT